MCYFLDTNQVSELVKSLCSKFLRFHSVFLSWLEERVMVQGYNFIQCSVVILCNFKLLVLQF